jgi:hypothetical protein
MQALIDRDFGNKINRLIDCLIEAYPVRSYSTSIISNNMMNDYVKDNIKNILIKHIKDLELYE